MKGENQSKEGTKKGERKRTETMGQIAQKESQK